MRKIFVSLLALLLVFAMGLSLVACGNDDAESTTTSGKTDGTTESTTTGDEGEQPPVIVLPTYKDDKYYTYRMAPSDLPEAWNIHTYQSNSATYVLDYSSDSLYTFNYNDDFTGYKIEPAMAKEFPIDVTSEYVGKYGIKEGDENKAYKIVLKDYLKFDNGEVLNAHSFVESMKLLLNPKAANFRADNVYASGQLKIVNAEAYVKQNTYALSEFVSANYGDDEYVNPADFTTSAAGILQANGMDIVVDLSSGGNWGSNGLDDYNGAGYLTSVQAAYDALNAAADENRWVKLTPELLKNVQDCIAALHEHANVEAYAEEAGDYAYQEFEEMAFLGKVWDAMEYEGNVGFFASADNELVVVLQNPMEDNFYLRYELMTSFFLVYAPLYKQCEKITDGVYTNSYGTSVDTYVGFGPYKLTQYTEGATLRLERNESWRGYTAEDYVANTYQTDAVNYQKVTEDAVRLEMFLKGEIDSYGLQAEDMADYIGSEYTYFNDSESTWYLAMNPQVENLTTMQATTAPVNAGNTVVKTPLAITEFRQALSYAINRTELNQLLSPTSGVAKALLSSMIIADPESGFSYRSMDDAKDAILSFWGLSDKWGEGKEYADRDEAIESITGYDPSGAKSLFDAAYDKAVEAGYITEDMIASGKWEVQITIGKPADANYYNKGYEFLKTCWTNAVVGTKFEGHVTFVQSQTLGSTTFGTYLRNGQIDLLFGVGYGGSMFDPYSMMDCFTGSLQYDPFTDKTAIDLDIEIDGKVLRASLYDWVSEALQGNTITCGVVGADGEVTGETVQISAGASDPAERRVHILAAAEEAVLNIANIFPLQTDASASLKCMRVNYKTEDYIMGVGRGGIEWYTYSMDDAEFAAHVTAQGGVLNYK